jgi:DNA/RNA-binding domain of Phe-tRNA-synthetase-like protein
MINITISNTLKSKCPNLALSAVSCKVKIEPAQQDLLKEINLKCQEIASNIEVADINKIPTIAHSRKAYKALGKDPSRYRLSAEALMRRIVKGKGIYHINNIVDLLNLVSITSGFSIGGYNQLAIMGDIVFDIGNEEPYAAIGRGDLNIENLPAFKDDLGFFGTPTSDSERTMISNNTQHFLMVIIGFGGQDGLEEATDLAIKLLKEYGNADVIENVFY